MPGAKENAEVALEMQVRMLLKLYLHAHHIPFQIIDKEPVPITPYTIHHIPYTIYHTPYTIHHIPYTIHHTPYIIYHIPYTIYHIPYTIYHTPYT
ncbi:hypothetical protein EON63_23855, partial [archaeon]